MKKSLSRFCTLFSESGFGFGYEEEEKQQHKAALHL
jgi:hypothetical protein